MAGTRGERTRAAIVAAALPLLAERGYAGTTMRAIATAAGVSTGNAYHYFPGKDALVQEFYAGIQRTHRERATAELAERRDLGQRLHVAYTTGIAVLAPHHRFAASFVSTAITPGAPASPFSAASAPSRAMAVGLFAHVVDGAATTPSPALRAVLPELLWLVHLGITLHWVHDDSPQQRRTTELIDAVAPLLATLIRSARLPGVRGLVDDVVGLYGRLRP